MAKNTVVTKGSDVAVNKAVSSATAAKLESAAYNKAMTFNKSEMSVMTDAQIDAAIKDIREKGMSLRRKAHITACGIMLHWAEHGDWTKIIVLGDALKKAMSNSMRARLIEWVALFSSLRWNKETEKFEHKKGAERVFRLDDEVVPAGERREPLKGALNQPFYAFDRDDDAKPRPFDFADYFQTVIKRVHAELDRKHELEGTAKTKRYAEKITVTDDVVDAIDKLALQLGVKLPESVTSNGATGGETPEAPANTTTTTTEPAAS